MFSVISRSVAVLLDQPAPPLMAAELRRYGPAARKGSVLSTVPQSPQQCLAPQARASCGSRCLRIWRR
jgi:hypothetical protein